MLARYGTFSGLFTQRACKSFARPLSGFQAKFPFTQRACKSFARPMSFFNGKCSAMENPENPEKTREKTGKFYRADKP